MIARAEIVHLKAMILYSSQLSLILQSISAYTKSLKLITHQLQIGIPTRYLKQINVFHKICTEICYAIAGVATLYVAAAYGLSDQNVLAQAIDVVSAVSMCDIATRVSMATVELSINGVSELFEIGNYTDV